MLAAMFDQSKPAETGNRKDQQVLSNSRSKFSIAAFLALFVVAAFAVAGCGDSDSSSGSDVSGTVTVDGSSTVYPFAQAAAESFLGSNPDVKITVGESGTGGGFEKFCAGEIDIANASRPIEPEEIDACKKKGITYKEIQVANDGVAIVTNKDLAVKCLTTKELNGLWKKGSKVSSLSELNPSLPSTKLSLYGPGTDSGTFDFFTEEINGEKGDSRTDYQPSEDDNITVQGVSGDAGGLGYFGVSYYDQNKDKLNLVGVDDGDGCVSPTTETIQNGTYKPLSRPLYMYFSDKAYATPAVSAFLEDTLKNHDEYSTTALIVPLTAEQSEKANAALAKDAEEAGATS
jgi:phosphate transport system substrate-binding protein